MSPGAGFLDREFPITVQEFLNKSGTTSPLGLLVTKNCIMSPGSGSLDREFPITVPEFLNKG